MKNIEKYEEEIRSELKNTFYVGCMVKKVKKIDCNDEFDCNTCSIRSFNWLLKEYKEPILNDEEKAIIKYIIKSFEPFGGELEYIVKGSWSTNEHEYYINFSYKNNATISPPFNKDKFFTNMELNKEYTLEELRL